MSYFHSMLRSVVRGATLILISGTIGCFVLDLFFGIFEPPGTIRFRHLSVIFGNFFIVIALCLLGATLGVLVGRFVHRRNPE